MLNRLRSAISLFMRARQAAVLGKRLDVILGKRLDPNEAKRRVAVQQGLHAEVMSTLVVGRSS